MTKRNQIASGLLVVLLLVFGYEIYSYRRPATNAAAPGATQGFQPLPVENPALRLDLLKQIKNFQYEGPRRNIFSTAPLPPPVTAQQQEAPPPQVAGPPAPLPGPPPLVVPATFFGRMTDRKTGAQRAFFNSGDDVYVLGPGDILLNRFRLVQIGESTAELEEIASGRRTSLTMERPAS
jgi:hypothetical protein